MEQDILQKMNSLCIKCASKSQAKSSQILLNDTPPAWFQSYMDTLKKEIIEEVSAKVVKDVLKVLNKQVREYTTIYHTDLNDEQNFEIVQLPLNCLNFANCTACLEKLGKRKQEASPDTSYAEQNGSLSFEECEEENNESNAESPSFELVSEASSPPVSICIDEDHFSTNENFSSSTNTNSSGAELCPERNLLFVVDVNGKIYKKHLFDNMRKIDIELQKQPDDISVASDSVPVNSTKFQGCK